MSHIVDDPIGYNLGALEDWSVLRLGLDCGRMTDDELVASMNSKHDPARDVAWLELKRRAILNDSVDDLVELLFGLGSPQ